MVDSYGRFTVLEIAPEMYGCAVDMMRTWPMGAIMRVPLPQGLAQSNTG